MDHSLTTTVHRAHNWEYATAAARTAATGFVATDVGKLARQTDDNSFWLLTATTPTWVRQTSPPEAWTAVTFQNSWVDFGAPAQVVQYRRVGDWVEIRGAAKSGAVGSTAFTLPAGFRPPSQISFATSSNSLFGHMNVNTDGTVVPTVGSNVIFHFNCRFSLL